MQPYAYGFYMYTHPHCMQCKWQHMYTTNLHCPNKDKATYSVVIEEVLWTILLRKCDIMHQLSCMHAVLISWRSAGGCLL